MFGLRVDLSIIEVFMDQSSSCTPQFEKATDDIQRNLLFPLSFGALDNIFFNSFGKTHSLPWKIFHGAEYLPIPCNGQEGIASMYYWRQECWPANPNQPNVVVPIRLLALHTAVRCNKEGHLPK